MKSRKYKQIRKALLLESSTPFFADAPGNLCRHCSRPETLWGHRLFTNLIIPYLTYTLPNSCHLDSLTSNHLTSNHLTSNHLTSNHLTSNHLTSNHLTSNPIPRSKTLLLPNSPSCRTTRIIAGQAPRSNLRHAIALQPTRTLSLRNVVLDVGLVWVISGVHILRS